MPVAIPINEMLQGISYIDSGEAIKVPEDNGRAIAVVPRYVRPTRWRSGCRLG